MGPPTAFCIKPTFTGGQLPYAAVLVSVVQQNESTVCSHIPPLRSPPHLGRRRALCRSLCATQ